MGPADPRQGGQAVGQRVGIAELAAQPQPFGEMLQGGVELAPLVGDSAETHVGGARGGQRPAVGHRGRLQHLLVGLDRQVQAAARALDLAQILGPQLDLVILVGRLPACDARGDGALGFPEPAMQPRSRPEQCPGKGVQPPLPLADLGQRPRRERHRGLTVAPRVGDERAPDRDHRGHVRQPADAPPGRRLVRFVSGVRERTLGGIQQVFDFLQAREACLRDQQPRPGVDRPRRQGRKPSLQGGALAAQEELVGVPLDQPRRPDRIPGGQRVAHGIVNRPMFLVPQAGVAVQLAHPLGILLLQAGAEQIGEQRVVAPPATHLVQRRQEQVGSLDGLQHLLAIGSPGDRVAQRSRQPVQH